MQSYVATATRWAWIGALSCFVIAGATGVLFRMGMIAGLPEGLTFGNVRHAHSHLMYFGWVTPALMALIASHLPIRRYLSSIIGVILVLAMAAYPPFLLYGYGLARIGSAELPLSVMLAGFNILAWYAFCGGYGWATKGLRRTGAVRYWDAALGFLVLASMGAWGVGIVEALGPSNPFWFNAALHLFLDLFADGWLLLAVLGLAHATIPTVHPRLSRWGFRLLVAGLPVTFLLGMPVADVSPNVRLVGGVGGVVVGVGLCFVVAALWRGARGQPSRGWTVPLSLLVVKAVAELGMSVPFVAEWAYGAGLRILYLHVLLLGGITLGVLAAAHRTWGAAVAVGWRVVTGAVVFLLLTLLPLTTLWPVAWSGPWVLYAASLGAAAPVLAMAGLLARVLVRRVHPQPQLTECHNRS